MAGKAGGTSSEPRRGQGPRPRERPRGLAPPLRRRGRTEPAARLRPHKSPVAPHIPSARWCWQIGGDVCWGQTPGVTMGPTLIEAMKHETRVNRPGGHQDLR